MNRKRLSFWRDLMDLQKTFDKVIDGGFYSPDNYYMCFALDGAKKCGAISSREHLAAEKQVSRYLGGWCSLEGALRKNGLPNSYDDRLKIYRDWANRPKLKRFPVSS